MSQADKIEMLASANDKHNLLEQARQAKDFAACHAICDHLVVTYKQLALDQQQAEAEKEGIIV